MSNGHLPPHRRKGVNRIPMKIRSHIRSVRLVFSIFLLQILAGLTGCKDDGTEFLEKELVQEESTEASGMDAEQEEPKDTESEVSGKESAVAAADISQKKQNESAEEPAPEVEKQLPEISAFFQKPLPGANLLSA